MYARRPPRALADTRAESRARRARWHEAHRQRVGEAAHDAQRLELVVEREPVARLHLDRRDAARGERAQPRLGERVQLVLAARAEVAHRGVDAAAAPRDLHVAARRRRAAPAPRSARGRRSRACANRRSPGVSTPPLAIDDASRRGCAARSVALRRRPRRCGSPSHERRATPVRTPASAISAPRRARAGPAQVTTCAALTKSEPRRALMPTRVRSPDVAPSRRARARGAAAPAPRRGRRRSRRCRRSARTAGSRASGSRSGKSGQRFTWPVGSMWIVRLPDWHGSVISPRA